MIIYSLDDTKKYDKEYHIIDVNDFDNNLHIEPNTVTMDDDTNYYYIYRNNLIDSFNIYKCIPTYTELGYCSIILLVYGYITYFIFTLYRE